MKNLLIISTLVLALMTTACTSDQITVTLEAAVDAAIAADSIARPQDAQYLAMASDCMNAAVTVLATTQTAEVKAATISLACAAAVQAGTTAPVGVQAVVAALSAFLRVVEATKTALVFSNPQMISAFAGTKAGKISAGRLKRIQKKLLKLKHKK